MGSEAAIRLHEYVDEPAVKPKPKPMPMPKRLLAIPQTDLMRLEEYRAAFRQDQRLRDADLVEHGAASWSIFDLLAEDLTKTILDDVLGVGELAEAMDSLVADLISKELEVPEASHTAAERATA